MSASVKRELQFLGMGHPKTIKNDPKTMSATDLESNTFFIDCYGFGGPYWEPEAIKHRSKNRVDFEGDF